MAAPRIQDLNAYSMAQIQRSLDQWNSEQKLRKGLNGFQEMDIPGVSLSQVRQYNLDSTARSKYKSGDIYGIEDEYRYLTEQKGFVGERAAAAADANTSDANTQAESAVPNFIKRYVNSGSTTHVGKAAVLRAQEDGKTLQDIRNASRNQGFTLAEGANKYIDQQLSNTTATALPDFISKYVNSGSTTHAGLTAVEKAVADGMSIADIQKASVAQNFQFASKAQSYLDDARGAAQQKNFDDQVAALAKQQESYLNDLRIEQDTRLSSMAEEQTRRANELATGQRTYQQNQSRSGQMGALQIGGGAQTPRTGGTQGFKRRKLQINPVTANALEGILGTNKGTKTTNTLNV